MKWWTPLVIAVATVTTAGCDSIPFLGKKAPDTTAAVVDTAAMPPATPVPAETTVTAPPPARAPARPAPTQRTVRSTALVDEPWTPTETGTVRPGMSRDEVVATWGAPVAERSAGEWMYLYFRNGCEVTCGTFDVVFLQDSQVVDAIVRGRGHTYAGVSSSPPDRQAVPTLPGGSTS